MAYTPYSFTIDPGTEEVVATLRKGAANGTIVRPFTSNNGSVRTTEDEFAVEAQSTFFLDEDGVYFLSLMVDGVERGTDAGDPIGFHLGSQNTRYVAGLVAGYRRSVALGGYQSTQTFRVDPREFDRKAFVNNYDATEALQAAVDSIKSEAGGLGSNSTVAGEVYIPAGHKAGVSAPIHFVTPVSFAGDIPAPSSTTQPGSMIYALPDFTTPGYILQHDPIGADDTYHWAHIRHLALKGLGRAGGVSGIHPGTMGETTDITGVALHELVNGIYLTGDQATAHLNRISSFYNAVGVNIDSASSTVIIDGLGGDDNTVMLRVKGGRSLNVDVRGFRAEHYTATYGDPAVDVVDFAGGLNIWSGWVEANAARSAIVKITRPGGGSLVPKLIINLDGNSNYTNLIDDQINTATTPLLPRAEDHPLVLAFRNLVIAHGADIIMDEGSLIYALDRPGLTYRAAHIPLSSSNTQDLRAMPSGLRLQSSDGAVNAIQVSTAGAVGFNGSTPFAKPTITGSRGGNAALASLISALASYGLVTDSTSA